MPEFLDWLIPLGIGIGIFLVLIIFLCKIYKVADVDKVLIITGGKEPVYKVSGGSFVIPIFRQASYFDLCMLTVTADKDEIMTKTAVPIVINWTAQIRPDSENLEVLSKAIISFKERGSDGIKEDVKRTLAGCVLGTVATMSPEEVATKKEQFKQTVQETVADELKDMGLKLISLNIGEVTDNNGYYEDIAATDREEKRKEAEKVKAMANQQIRQQTAESEKIAKQSELDTELQIAEKNRDNDLKKAAFKVETDKANADAEIAGELQRTIRMQEIAEKEGQVEVVRQEQANLAAIKEKEVIKTRAEAEKIQAEIKASEEATVATINAEAEAKVMEQKAAGKAKAIKTEAEAEANATKIKGETEAEIISKRGMAEAEAIKAKKLAEAEGEKALAEARAGNDKVNFEIEKIKIENEARVQIATNMATVMAEVGKNAEFVNIGGSSNGVNGNVLIDTLSQIPGLMKTLDVSNNALNGKSFNDSISDVVAAIADPLKGLGLLSTSTSVENTNIDTSTESKSTDVVSKGMPDEAVSRD